MAQRSTPKRDGRAPTTRRQSWRPLRGAALVSALATTVLLGFALLTPIVSVTIDYVDAVRELSPGLERGTVEWALRRMVDEDRALATVRSYSVVGGVEVLLRREAWVAAALVAGFSVVFPLIKTVLTLIGALSFSVASGALSLLARLHKWALLDVFAIAVVVVTFSNFPFATITIEPGFYWFLGYYFVAFAAIELLRAAYRRRQAALAAAADAAD